MLSIYFFPFLFHPGLGIMKEPRFDPLYLRFTFALIEKLIFYTRKISLEFRNGGPLVTFILFMYIR